VRGEEARWRTSIQLASRGGMVGESEVDLRSVSWWMWGQGVYALGIAVGGEVKGKERRRKRTMDSREERVDGGQQAAGGRDGEGRQIWDLVPHRPRSLWRRSRNLQDAGRWIDDLRGPCQEAWGA
jgi:hypothetical protein